MKCYHPHKDDKGHPVLINNPSHPTSLSSWDDATRISTAVPGSPMPESIGFIIRSWTDAPDDSAGWERCVQALRFDEPEFKVKPGKSPASGAVIVEDDGRVWVVSPTNGYAGYENTFPKGKVSDLSLRANAMKETYEESGLQVELIRFLTDSERSTTTTRYYLARCIGGNPADMGWESQAVHLVPQDQLAKFVTHKNDAVILRALADIQTIATKYSWKKLKPMPKRHTIIQLNIKLNREQAERVRQGFIPSMMEEKWFSYFDDNILYQHRSWTGILIDQIYFVEDGDGLRATYAEVNRHTADYGNKDDEEDRERITQMVLDLANSPFGAKSKAIDPIVSALEEAVPESFGHIANDGYLGNPEVVNSLVAEFCTGVFGLLDAVAGGVIGSDEYNKLSDKLIRDHADIFAGRNESFTIILGYPAALQMKLRADLKSFWQDNRERYEDDSICCLFEWLFVILADKRRIADGDEMLLEVMLKPSIQYTVQVLLGIEERHHA